MPETVSGFGLVVRILASNTFPPGVDITQFADDADPLDFPALPISGSAMGLNGDLVGWTMANPIPMVLNVIAGSEDDTNLNLLFQANRAGKGKASAKDVISSIVTYPDGRFTTLFGGLCMEFIPSKGVASEGRFKTNAYTFNFEGIVGL